MSNNGIYPASSGGTHSFSSRDPRTGQPGFSGQNNQPVGVLNDQPTSSSSVGNCADVQSKSKKKSIVITNSNLPPATQNQSSLCRVEFQNDKISLALPPGMTWEEINAKPPTPRQIDQLLQCTYQINAQLRKKKRRVKHYQNSMKFLDPWNQHYPPPRSCASVPIRNPLAKNSNHCESKPGPSLPNKTKICPKPSLTETNLKQNPSKSIAENDTGKQVVVKPDISDVASTSSKSINVVPVIESETSVKLVDVNSIRKYSREELFEANKPDISNPEIIEAVTKYVIFSTTTPFAKNLSRQLKPSQNRNYDLKPPDLKELMRLSWAGSDDGGDAETSKQIFENLSNQAENFNAKSADSWFPKIISKQHPTDSTDSTKNAKKKKKKKLEKLDKKADQPDQNKAPEDPVETFDEYYDDLTIQEGLKNGTMFQDILRINGKNWREAFVTCSANNEKADNKDIFIDGIKNRNRALDGDEVVVELLPEKQTDTSEDGTKKGSTQKSGKVVRIIKENHPRTAVGSLKPVYKKKQMKIFHSPLDPRLPRIKIPLGVCVSLARLCKLNESVVYLAQITKWESVKHAEGVLLKEIGDIEDPKVESQCILMENHLDVTPFESSDKSIPSLPYKIPDDEINRRLDLRNSCVFTIDPPGAQDLDDALSCRILPNNNIEIGIHIADVTHFLKSDTPLDLNARKKATSVYLTETVYHMLPFELCKLCSLTPGEDKFAFSVMVELDEDANVINHTFNKTVLRSCVQLTYAHAQDVIENDSESYEPKSFPPVLNGFTANDCVCNIRILQKLASIMRKRRFAGGALRIDQPKIVFKLDEKRLPNSFSLYHGQECNWLIEEFMLLANALTAEKILESFPDTALLRRHDAPKEKYLSTAVEYLEKVGIFIDTTDAGSIYQSMTQYEGTDEIGMARMAVITNFLVKPMVKAMYVCSSGETDRSIGYWHYALNMPYYTHFTSPIRRYADVVVHRLLAASIGLSKAPPWSSDLIREIANNCNTKKNRSKKASETSAELYLKIYLERCGPIKARAVVIDVKERHFELMDLTTRTVCRIQINKIQRTEKVEFENDNLPSIKVMWKNNPEPLEQIIQIFTIVDVKLSYQKNSGHRLMNKVQVELLKPAL